MKKLISILIVIASLMQFAFVSAEEVRTNSSDTAIKKLQYLDMILPEMQGKQNNLVARGKFSKYLFYYLGITVPKTESKYFYDVPETHEYANGINYMLDCGYIKKTQADYSCPIIILPLKMRQ